MPHSLANTDSELLQLLAQDDRDAFDIIYTRYWYFLYQCAYHVFRDHEACMDIVQDVFVWLWTKRKEIQVHTSLPSYLKAAVKFKTANYIRSGKVRESFFQEAAAIVAPATPTSEDALEVKELKTIILHTITHLPEKCREIFQMSRNEHLSNREIASRLGISEKTVENQMTIALKRIRSAVEQYMLYLLL